MIINDPKKFLPPCKEEEEEKKTKFPNKSPNFLLLSLPLHLHLPYSNIQGRGFFSRRFPSTTHHPLPVNYILSKEPSRPVLSPGAPLHDR